MTWTEPGPNLLTFDIEGFIEASHDSMHVPVRYISVELEAEEISVNTEVMLDLLEAHNQTATFFVLGRIARDMPALVRRVADAGHEIACHSFEHRRLFHFEADQVKTFIGDAKRLLEDASGKAVFGFRAPDFSIIKANLWVFDILADLGFKYDSSVYPIDFHDVYGIRNFPTRPFRLPNGLIEVPLSTVRVFNRNIPFGGGGYLRLYPLLMTELFFRIANRRGSPGIVYLHPFEMGKIVRNIEEMGALRRFRTYTGVRTAKDKLAALLRRFRFEPVADYLAANPVLEDRL